MGRGQKCNAFRMQSNLSDFQLKIDFYVYIYIDIHEPHGNYKPKPTIDTHNRRKEPKHTTEENHQAIRRETKDEERNKEELQKQPEKINKYLQLPPNNYFKYKLL